MKICVLEMSQQLPRVVGSGRDSNVSHVFSASHITVFPCFRVVGLIGVDAATEVKKLEADPAEDQNDNSPLLS